MQSVDGLVRAHPFFWEVEDRFFEEILPLARPISATTNQFLFREGGDADCFILLTRGDVALELHVPPRGARIIETVTAGEIIGWSWIVPPYKWTFDARALTDIEGVCLEGPGLRDVVAADPELAALIYPRLVRVIVDRLRASRIQMLDVYANG